MILSGIVLSIICVISVSTSHLWNYQDQYYWPGDLCSKITNQSPIDLVESTMTIMYLKPFVFTNWNKVYDAELLNDGHSIDVYLRYDGPITVEAGGLPGLYKLHQIHFHWPSEHTINGRRKALEQHFVTYQHQYESIDDAKKHYNGIAVIGVLYKLSAQANENLLPIVNNIGKVKNFENSTMITINPSKLLPRNLRKFYRYSGSLTTPDCNEGVVWTIFSDVDSISPQQKHRH
ncbi:carbonic anhydrase 14-like [Harmonia axyridis]|uniref:carbonic anhydrase 14-like n=1 Tax=Harmonia axyridis TaxID=115357 RepID=UPI001E27964A|nr:carbonic anhydrase 14-like [Harmonia axyridis]